MQILNFVGELPFPSENHNDLTDTSNIVIYLPPKYLKLIQNNKLRIYFEMEEQKTYNDEINEVLEMLKEMTDQLKLYIQNMINNATEWVNKREFEKAVEYLEGANEQQKIMEEFSFSSRRKYFQGE